MCDLRFGKSRLFRRMRTAIVRSGLPSRDLFLDHDRRLCHEVLGLEVGMGSGSGVELLRHRVVLEVDGSMMEWAVVDIRVAPGRHHWGSLVEGRRNQLVAQVVLTRLVCVFGRTEYSLLRIVVGNL